jgi:hypothetical protein
VIEHDLLIDKVFVVFLLQAVDFKVKVKGTHWVTGRLVIRKM